MGFVAFYTRCVHRAPYTTKAVGTGVTYAFSDATAQALEYGLSSGASREAEDAKSAPERALRTLKFSAVGACWVGPLLAAWFNVMDALVPGKTFRPIAKKLIIDQVIQGPFMIATMYAWCAALNGRTFDQIQRKLDDSLWQTWVNSVYVWAPVQIAQQAVVPIHYRVAVANIVSYFWDTYLSYMMMTDASVEAPAPEPALVPEPEPEPEAAPKPDELVELRRRRRVIARHTTWRIIDDDDDDEDDEREGREGRREGRRKA